MNYYDEISMGYNELYGDEQRQKYAFLKDWLLQLKGRTLDIGSGTGIINEFITPFVLTDLSFNMLKKASGKRIVCDARYLPFKDKSFDNITCFSVLQDIFDKKQVINEIKRVCKNKVVLTILKRLKSREEVESLFKEFSLIEYREEEKDHCFFLEIKKEKEVKKTKTLNELEITKF